MSPSDDLHDPLHAPGGGFSLVEFATRRRVTIAMMTLTFNLWLAARVTVASGRLNRPWPDLRATTLPRTVLFALIAVLVLCFTGGLVALAAQITSAALLMAYGMTGFAVLHPNWFAHAMTGPLTRLIYQFPPCVSKTAWSQVPSPS